ncbi:MAG: S-layer homology domain-containing protein [Lachnospiraceae bacterium]|nr:S-layer homology domain-containing protein [Lachnospiraceae bacterium]
MRQKGNIGKRIACILLSMLLWSEGSLVYAQTAKVRQTETIQKDTWREALPESKVEAVNSREEEQLDYVLGRPMTEEEDAAERQRMEEYISRLVPLDPGPEAPRLESGREPIVSTIPLPESYDGREEHLITSVKNQSPYGICWAFTSVLLAEASMVKKELLPLSEADLSEYHLAYYTYRFITDPLKGTEGDSNYRANVNDILDGGSNIGRAKNTLIGWMGAVPENVAEFTSAPMELPMTEAAAYGHNIGILKNVMEVNINDREAAKQAILDYGALGIMYYATTSPSYYNTSTAAHYVNSPDLIVNHAVAIVGWDDTYSKENFGYVKPANDGAWLIRNSWGPSYGKDGYFWMSYEDATIYPTVYAFEMEAPTVYDNNYQYDGAGMDEVCYTMNIFEVANVFTASANPGKAEILKAVSFDIDTANVNYSIQIYKNPQNPSNPTSGTAMIKAQTGTTSHAGYYTIDLDEEVWLQQGDTFAVVITFTKSDSAIYMVCEFGDTEENAETKAQIDAGQSFFKLASGWADMADYAGEGYYNLRIKAFTVNRDEIPVTGITMAETTGTIKVGETKQLEAEVIPTDATNQTIHWHSLAEDIASVDENGLVTGKSQGTVEIAATAEDGEHSIIYRLTVEADPVITSVEASQITAHQATVTIEANDGNNSQIADYRLEMTEGEGSPVITKQEAENTFFITHLSPVTAYTFQAEVEDSAGNTVQSSVSFTTPKELGAAAPEVGGGYEVNQTDGSTYVYTLKQIEGAEYQMDEEGWQESPVFEDILPNSTHIFYVRIKETDTREAGETRSTGEVEFPEIIPPDTEPPILEVTVGEGEAIAFEWYSMPQVLEIRAKDGGSGISSVSYQVDEGEEQLLFVGGEAVSAEWNNEAEPIQVQEGEHSYTICVTDKAGYQTVKTVEIRQDTLAPVLSELEIPSGDKLGEDFAKIAFQADDNGSFYYMLKTLAAAPTVQTLLLQDKNIMAAGGSCEISLKGLQPDTDYMVYILAQDKAGNLSEKIFTVAFHTKESIVNPEPIPIVQMAAAPNFSIKSGTYSANQYVTIQSATEGAAIYYTMDGTRPDTSSAKYTTAIQVDRSVTIKAIAIKEGMTDSQIISAVYVISRPFPFTDVAQDGQWKHQSVKYVWDNSMMNGISGTTLFAPDDSLTRAMFATVLYRMAGRPTVEFTTKFSDVKAGQWYSDAIIWANQQGIVAGRGDGSYGIDQYITREQIAKMLYEYARVRGYDITARKELSSFTDEKEVSSWAVGYMQWATAVEMITGKPNTDETYRMDPKGQATRAECAAMLMRFENRYDKEAQ